MQNKIPLHTIIHVSKLLAEGKSLWALLTLNEYYFERRDPIISALISSAAKQLLSDKYRKLNKVCQQILNGEVFENINMKYKEMIRQAECTSATAKKSIPDFSSICHRREKQHAARRRLTCSQSYPHLFITRRTRCARRGINKTFCTFSPRTPRPPRYKIRS